jgi:FSR family fosmidomycin resistance protein-like MFS transporter
VSAQTSLSGVSTSSREKEAESTAFRILAAISFCHLLNDMMQSVIPAVYPILKTSYHLDFGQIGLITLTGLVLLVSAPTFSMILVAMVGMGSSVFHPESSRIARMASGGQHGSGAIALSGRPVVVR